MLGGAASTGSDIQYGFSEGLQFPPFNKVVRPEDEDPLGAASGNGTESKEDATLTALKNAFNTAQNAIKALSVDGPAAPNSNANVTTLGLSPEDELQIAYMAASAAAAPPGTTTTEFGEEAAAKGLEEEKDHIAVWLGKFTIPLRFRYQKPVVVRGIRLRCVVA